MAKISLKELKQYLTYHPETGLFTWNYTRYRTQKGSVAGGLLSDGYISIRIDGRRFMAHRLAFLYVHGYMPVEIDHINRIRHDNRIINLRSVTHKQNMMNRSLAKNNSSGYNGVSLFKPSGKWRAGITIDGEFIHLGYFDNPEDANNARLKADQELINYF